MPTLHTRSLPNDYRDVNRDSTEPANRDGHREFHQERTEAMIRMTFTKMRSTGTLLNAQLRDGEICKCNVQSGFPREEARFNHGEYDRLLRCLRVRYGSIMFHLRPMQLASILPPLSGHQKCYMRITVTMPGAEAQIVRSQQGIYLMINLPLYYHGQFRQSSLPRLNLTKPKLYRISCRSTNESQFQFNCNTESPLHCYRATMAIDNQYDGEVVDGATNFEQREIPVSVQ